MHCLIGLDRQLSCSRDLGKFNNIFQFEYTRWREKGSIKMQILSTLIMVYYHNKVLKRIYFQKTFEGAITYDLDGDNTFYLPEPPSLLSLGSRGIV